jgi:hypothetical protein
VDRFLESGIPDLDQPKLAVYRADPDWKRLYSFLRHGYWHGQSLQAWEVTRQEGAIKPNIDGRYPMRFEFQTLRSYGYNHKCVALFDFMTPSEDQVIRSWGHAWDVLVNEEAPTILIQLNRKHLEQKIIPNSQGMQPAPSGKQYGCIPFCEVWYPDEIPTAAITSVYRVPANSDFELCSGLIREPE